MTRPAHTVGPWERRMSECGTVIRIEANARSDERTVVGYATRRTLKEISEGHTNVGCSETSANARLIACSPEGFDLIEQLEESFTADGTYQQFLPAMRAYLAKAGGRS